MRSLFLTPILFLMTSAGLAGEADVVDVRVTALGDGEYRFDVTLRHSDEGWGHYVDKWDLLTPDGKLLGTRTLYHPHVDEQPFTRSLAPVRIPEGLNSVRVRAHDSVHGLGGEEIKVVIHR
ncbi:hypothetical protein BOW51_09630 [Solemya velesiana gill symbiont]|uniref:Uncharacterized protein n=2 Tax=Solemya velesiana gill symbiont TaxID=1918948 RepID=A0A1T2KSZ0_9GAMM|nr:hypothetical protein BOW51_09630 [Solemya velesiana gill symbiont]